MKRILRGASGLLVSLLLPLASARAVESTWNYSVQASATVQSSPARVTLTWPQDTSGVPSSYTVYRKAPGATSWGTGTTLAGTTTSYTDTAVSAGQSYEYRIDKAAGGYTGYGYILAGIEAPLVDDRGSVVLVVDSTFTTPLAAELARLEEDLRGDGWTVVRRDVSRFDSPAVVKAAIQAAYAADPTRVKSVFLFGHVPVPYSGQLNPDGHPDHIGAWPADAYYGDMTGTWTDFSVNYTQTVNTDPADAKRLTNLPGDGKFDQSDLPASVTLEVGRVDLANMPGRVTWGGPATFPSETELLRKYLNKDHAFRHRAVNPPRRALLGDYFGVRNGEAFAASGFRSFAPLVGAANIRNLNVEFNDQKGVWIPQAAQNDYLLAYACGAGSYWSIGGLGSTGLYNDGTTTELVGANVRPVFNLLFGSWLGDWDHEDNFLRAPLATDYGLVSAWSGRPHWFLHPLGLGQTIGATARLTQNNSGLYQNQINSSARRVHIALMGDPTLRLHPVIPAGAISGTVSGTTATLTWPASTDTALLGYHVYRAPAATGTYTRLTTSPVTTTTYSDASAATGTTYMVRAVRMETSPSGTYLNAAQGVFWTVGSSSTSGGTTSGGTTSGGTTGGGTTSGGTTSGGTTTGGTTLSNPVIWFDDALPAGAGTGTNGDTWNWISSNPTPQSGTLAHRSDLRAGLHEHLFNWASPLTVNAGDVLYTYVYLDPANPPSEIMLSWATSNWEHRAYWGANLISYGTNGTSSRAYLGPLPAAGQWVRLEVPARTVALEGTQVVGMGFSAYDGAVTWDNSGKFTPTTTTPAPVPPTVTVAATDNSATIGSTTDLARLTFTRSGDTTTSLTVTYTLGGNAVPLTDYRRPQGDLPTTITIPAGAATATMDIQAVGNVNNAANLTATFTLATNAAYTVGSPSSATLTFLPAVVVLPTVTVTAPDATAIIGSTTDYARLLFTRTGDTSASLAVSITLGENAVPVTDYRRSEGDIPTTFLIPAGTAAATMDILATGNVNNAANLTATFTLATSAAYTVGSPASATLTFLPATTTTTATGDTAWMDDALPAGATTSSTSGGDAWTWISTNPKPYSKTLAHQSNLARGLHDHAFNGATSGLKVAAGDKLYAYVFLDPANPPTEVMLSWAVGTNWEHRAYWGLDRITYGKKNTVSRARAGNLPAAGQWVRLEVPASTVGLEGTTVTGMGFSLFDGRATWDVAGVVTTVTTVVTTPTSPTPASTYPAVTTATTTPTNPTTPPAPALAENAFLRLPVVGDHRLRVLAPTVLELQRITTKDPDPALPADWNFVDASGNYLPPAASKFTVTVNGQAVGVTGVGFRRRVAYAPVSQRDLRIDNSIYLTLAAAVPDNAAVEVRNADGSLWPATMTFAVAASPLRFSPAVHVNQEGYVPSLPKRAMVGLWLGNLGEMDINAANGFRLVSAATGATVYSGALTLHRETGFTYTPMPYQKVYVADFSGYTAAGEYQLVVPGLGASLPFVIDDGIAMLFTRTYAAGLYHQRCGAALTLPYSRFTHAACHTAAAEVPSPQSSYAFTWTTIASKNADAKTDPRHTAPQLKDEASQLYPFVNQGTVDVSGGHHDAGDYSKYTINVAQLAHLLTFTADAVGGAGALDNLGLPESGDGRSDILQEAKHEADYLAKLQDADGGFYFIVYPKTREYESNVAPDRGDPQVVWPKNTSATAAGVAALAQMASSPAFKAAYPAEAAAYLARAKLGWQFLTNAIATHGKDGSYQKVTFYGNNYLHDDELAWAACELYLATGDTAYHAKLLEWFPNPADPATFRWGWWRMSESWGNAIRSYAFAARTGRLAASQLNATYLAACEQQIKLAGDDALAWSNSCAYGSAFPEATRRVLAAGWYFSLDQASDMAVAYQLNPKPDYLRALVGNLNYEAGTNPVNAVYLTGVGLRRQHEMVHQWANNNRQVLPLHGVPLGNIQAGFDWLTLYASSAGNELSKLSFPSDANGSVNMYPFYDRWADSWNVTTEFITVNQARSLLSSATLAAQTAARAAAWKPSATATILVPALVPVGSPTTLTLTTSGLDLTGARITWEARDQEPDFGASYVIVPKNNGAQWAEAEILWPDGRRVFATAAFTADSPVVTWVDDALPLGAWTSSSGGDGWTWVTSSPAPQSGTKAHQSALAAGLHEHGFNDATSTLNVATGDSLFCWVYLDPANVPEEIMLHWNDGTWEHRAFWGADKILYGTSGTASRRNMGPLPAAGGWVKLVVPASAVALEGSSVKGMCFSAYGGRVTWDAAGKTAAGP